jgi:signal transduction histidine kinase/ActR/RegA family two-component response regulator/HAMP domain-containing protein
MKRERIEGGRRRAEVGKRSKDQVPSVQRNSNVNKPACSRRLLPELPVFSDIPVTFQLRFLIREMHEILKKADSEMGKCHSEMGVFSRFSQIFSFVFSGRQESHTFANCFVFSRGRGHFEEQNQKLRGDDVKSLSIVAGKQNAFVVYTQGVASQGNGVGVKTPFSDLRIRLVATVFIAIAPVLVLNYFTNIGDWAAFLVGLGALAAAWFGGEHYVLKQVRALYTATRKLAGGDLSSRTGLSDAKGELGELARNFDGMAERLQQRVRESEKAERTLLNRALQQTAVAAIGQFALISNDLNALLNQAVTLVSQTLDVEFCEVLELHADGTRMVLRSGTGWKKGSVGNTIVETGREYQPGFTLGSGEPVVVEDYKTETRFKVTPLVSEHGIVSGLTVAILTRQLPFGVFGAYTGRRRSFTGDEVHFLLAVATALGMAVERNRAEANMQKLAVFAQLNPNAAMELADDGSITYFNDAALKLAFSLGKNHLRDVLPQNVEEIVASCLSANSSRPRMETKVNERTLSWLFHPVPVDRIVHCYVEDITERLSLEGQLRQAQKMESIGQLAAGVAHDFNNMLTIIQGHAGLLMAKAELTSKMFASAQAVYFAAERAAGLTRQLLMFSRKNVMQLRSLDLREAVSDMTKLLNRLLGANVKLEFDPPIELPMINADSGMLEQVVMNLAVNARDAMPKGGTLTISVGPVQIDEEYVQGHPEAREGAFVCLRVTDTGTGIDSATMSRIFEPFFTTKEIGKGTGLGLATVYGIVKQHEGWIEVSSEVGKGSRFSVFLPATEQTTAAVKRDTDPTAFVRGGSETILVVEDEDVLRDMAHTILEESGYRILDAANGKEAIGVWEKHRDEISLLLTDMVMPEGVSGVDLAERVLADNPNLKVIFTSGYTMDEISTGFLRKTNGQFLQKPYTRITLVRAVRQALDGENTAS